MRRLCIPLILALIVAQPLRAQDHGTMDHGAMDHATMDHSKLATSRDPVLPTLPGQDAYGAISEVVRLLQNDPATDWSKVNIEALRQHLIDMNGVTLRSSVRQTVIPGGLEMIVTGDSTLQDAIRRMTTAHGAALRALGLTAASTPVPGGSRFVVTVADSSNGALVAQVRGLGFAGLMTVGNHHAMHHLAIARGESMAGHAMD